MKKLFLCLTFAATVGAYYVANRSPADIERDIEKLNSLQPKLGNGQGDDQGQSNDPQAIHQSDLTQSIEDKISLLKQGYRILEGGYKGYKFVAGQREKMNQVLSDLGFEPVKQEDEFNDQTRAMLGAAMSKLWDMVAEPEEQAEGYQNEMQPSDKAARELDEMMGKLHNPSLN